MDRKRKASDGPAAAGGGASKLPRTGSSTDGLDTDSPGAQLIDAAGNGHIEEALQLLEAKRASLRTTRQGRSALDAAITATDLPMVQLLLKHGADPNFDGKQNTGAGQGAPPIVRAARRGSVGILQAMLQANADVNQTGGVGQSGRRTRSRCCRCLCWLGLV